MNPTLTSISHPDLQLPSRAFGVHPTSQPGAIVVHVLHLMSSDPYSCGQWRADEFASIGRGECSRGFRFGCYRRRLHEFEFDAEHVYLRGAPGDPAAILVGRTRPWQQRGFDHDSLFHPAFDEALGVGHGCAPAALLPVWEMRDAILWASA